MQLSAVQLGAGARATQNYGPYAMQHPEQLTITAVAEKDEGRLALFADQHGVTAERRFSDWRTLLSGERMADCALLCLPADEQPACAKAALERGYHVLLESPVGVDLSHISGIVRHMQHNPTSVVMMGNELRYSALFSTVKHLIGEGRIGQPQSLTLTTGLEHILYSHVSVRSGSTTSAVSPLLATGWQGMALLNDIANGPAQSVCSYGALSFFTDENAPEGAPARCLDGCPAENTCPYFAPRIYLTPNTNWPVDTISTDLSFEGRRRALLSGPYGRCVFRCPNTSDDHLTALVSFGNGALATLTISAFSMTSDRTLHVMGSCGELRASQQADTIEVSDFLTGQTEIITVDRRALPPEDGEGMLLQFLEAVATGQKSAPASHGDIEAHLLAAAAELSRREGGTVDMGTFRRTAFGQ